VVGATVGTAGAEVAADGTVVGAVGAVVGVAAGPHAAVSMAAPAINVTQSLFIFIGFLLLKFDTQIGRIDALD
jgi:hypothetical protein